MPLSLRDYSTPELEALLDCVKAAILEAEKAERQRAKRPERIAGRPPPDPERRIALAASPPEAEPPAAAAPVAERQRRTRAGGTRMAKAITPDQHELFGPGETPLSSSAPEAADITAGATPEPPAPIAKPMRAGAESTERPEDQATEAIAQISSEAAAPAKSRATLSIAHSAKARSEQRAPAADEHSPATRSATAKTADDAVQSSAPPESHEGSQTGESAAPRSAPSIKYMHPSNRKMTWSGEGEQPEWMKIYLALGGTWTALENTAQRFAGSRSGRATDGAG